MKLKIQPLSCTSLATFHVLNKHMWLGATVLDSRERTLASLQKVLVDSTADVSVSTYISQWKGIRICHFQICHKDSNFSIKIILHRKQVRNSRQSNSFV